MTDGLEIFDVLQFFEPIDDRFLNEMIHDYPPGAAVFLEGFLEARVYARIDLYGRRKTTQEAKRRRPCGALF